MQIIEGSNGRIYEIDEDNRGVVIDRWESREAYEAYMEDAWDVGPTCPICDALGCGGDGGGCYQYEGRGEFVDPRDLEPVF